MERKLEIYSELQLSNKVCSLNILNYNRIGIRSGWVNLKKLKTIHDPYNWVKIYKPKCRHDCVAVWCGFPYKLHRNHLSAVYKN